MVFAGCARLGALPHPLAPSVPSVCSVVNAFLFLPLAEGVATQHFMLDPAS